jgi:hypothetical protein
MRPIRSLTVAALSLAVFGLGMTLAAGDAQADRNVKNTTRTNVNKNVNVNKNTNRNTNVNVNRDTNVNVRRDVDIDVDVDRGFHPVGTALAVGATVAVTAAVVGSMTRTLPPACVPVQIGAVLYQQCGAVWYQPQYAGSSVQYIVINPPR